jgi:hypothetical protein
MGSYFSNDAELFCDYCNETFSVKMENPQPTYEVYGTQVMCNECLTFYKRYGWQCKSCKESFVSGNQLFKHLNENKNHQI